jgi:hypothetical protein
MGKKTKKVKQQSATPQVVSSVDGKDSFWGRYKYLLLVIGLSVFGIWPLFLPVLYQSHDLSHHLHRLAQFAIAFRDGQFPVRWLPDMMLGHGLPVFMFVSPLSYYMALIPHFLGLGAITSYKIVMALSITLSGIAMFVFARELFSRNASLVVAVAYMFAPYRFVDVYVRGAMPESMVFVFIPLAFLFTKRIVECEQRGNLLLLSVSVAGIILTHNVTAVFIIPAVLLYGVFLVVATKNYIKILSFAFPYLAALGLSAFYWLPALIEKKYTLLEHSMYGVKFFNFRDHFVFFRQVISPFWDYGGSEVGLTDGMSFQLGSLYLAVSVVGGVLAFYLKDRLFRIHTIYFLSVLGVSIFMMNWWAKPLWEILPLISLIQFPWRFLTLAVFSSACLMGTLIHVIESRPEWAKRTGIMVLALLPCFLLPSLFLDVKEGIFKTTYLVLYYVGLSALFLTLWMIRRFERKILSLGLLVLVIVTTMPFWNVSLHSIHAAKPDISKLHEDVLKPEMMRQRIVRGGATFEFIPISVKKFVTSTFVNEQNVVEVVAGEAELSGIERKSDSISFSVKASETARILVRIFYFPGWTCFIDGKEISTTLDDYGRMLFSVPSGIHNVVVKLKDTDTRKAANIVSIVTMCFMLSAELFPWLRQRKKSKK